MSGIQGQTPPPPMLMQFNNAVTGSGGFSASDYVMRSLSGCVLRMPDEVCALLNMLDGSTYDAAYRLYVSRRAQTFS